MIHKISNIVIRAFSASASSVILLYFYAISFFLMLWEISIGGIVTLISLFTSIMLWKLVYRRLFKIFRGFIFAFFALCFGGAIFGLVGSLGAPEKVPLYSTLIAVILGLSTEMTTVFSIYDMFKRASFCERAGLRPDNLSKQFLALPQQMQGTEEIITAYAAAGQLPWLFANSEYKTVVIIIGGIFETLLRSVYRGKQNCSVPKKAKTLKLNVTYGENNMISNTSFDIEYFWRNVRSKYAHSIRMQKIAPATFSVDEPTEETAKQSVGLLGVFLKEYSNYCKRKRFLDF